MGNDVQFEVDTRKLQVAADAIEKIIREYNAEWRKLIDDVEELSKEEWRSLASDAFNQQIRSYQPNFEEIATVLQSFADFLRTAKQNYENTDKAIEEAANAMRTK